jgi:hypothetical protein
MTIGSYGDILFEFLNAPTEINQSLSIRYAEHELFTQNSEIEYVGRNRTDLSYTIRLRQFDIKDLGMAQTESPEEQLDRLLLYAKGVEANLNYNQRPTPKPFFVGNRYLGQFVIVSLNVTFKAIKATTNSAKGTIEHIDIDVSLKEMQEPRKGQVSETATIGTPTVQRLSILL